MENKDLHKTISNIWKDNYIVPLYQRNFAWGEEQIMRLLQDIYDRCDTNDNYYIGSLVVLERTDGLFEVIDGQQRLTCLQLICRELGIFNSPCLKFDSRPEVEDFLNGLYNTANNPNSSVCRQFYHSYPHKDSPKTYRLVDALRIIADAKLRKESNDKIDSFIPMQNIITKLGNYIKDKVILVRTTLPSDTDVAAYFEIMNNRGEQLQEHEVVKALMMRVEKLPREKYSVFATIWDACSQMDIPIQRTLSTYRKKDKILLFGPGYDSLDLNPLKTYNESEKDESLTIEKILERSTEENKKPNKDEEIDVKNRAIIDFPNFLMHLFKTINETVPLNAEHLLSEYKDKIINFDSWKFLLLLLRARLLFDRYVVRVQGDDDESDELKWVLKKPYRNKSDELKFKNTFPANTGDVDDGEVDSEGQQCIIKLESMLQVSFRNRKYKNWLFDLLNWMMNIKTVDEYSLKRYLSEWIYKYYNDLVKESGETLMNAGTDTPHFLFNFIDLLYWLEDPTKRFNFKYYNSVEHHYPQSYEELENGMKDNIGNLFLISRRKNSSLNDKGPTEKARNDQDLMPKRARMYEITKTCNTWGLDQIEKHRLEIETLIDKAKDLLSYQ